MYASLLQRTSAATALLLAAVGMPTPLLAVPVAQPVAATQTVSAPSSQHHLHGLAEHRLLHPAAAHSASSPAARGKRAQTPFDRIMLPKIQAQQARDRADGKVAPRATAASLHPAASTGLVSSTGQSVNFPGLQQPAWFYSTAYTTDSSYTNITLTADVNKDGKPDLVSIQYDGTINVMLNSGTGFATVLPVVNTSLQSTPEVDWASTVDLNNDGYPDLELVDAVDGIVYIFMNKGTGDGSFAAVQTITLALPTGNTIGLGGGGSTGGDVIFSDVTGDGFPDMIVVSGQHPDGNTTQISVQVFVGVDDGTFPTTSLPAANQTLASTYLYGSYHSVKAADMNGDGKIDLVYPSSGYASGAGGDYFAYNYILTGGSNGVFSSFPAVSNTTTGAYAISADEYLYQSFVGKVSTSATEPSILVAGELGTYSQPVSSSGVLQTAVATTIPTLYDNAYDIYFADLNGDGAVDIVTSSEGFFSIFLGNGDNTFGVAPSAQYVGGYNDGETEPIAADFNGDGKVDIVNTGYYGDAGLFLGTGGTGNHMLAGAPLVANPIGSAVDIEAVMTGNITGHGYSDVLTYDYTNSAQLDTGINDGKGNFTYVTALSHTALSSVPWSFVYSLPVDINNDGKTDLLISGGDGLYYALSNGDGTFANPVALPLGGVLGCALNYGATGDINGDGKTDMVFGFGGCGTGDFTSDGYFTLLNNGDGTYTPSFTALGSTSIYSVSLADMNNDGKLDLVALAAGTNDTVEIIPGNGDGTFATANLMNPWEDANIYGVTVGDYNSDGKQDLTLFGYVESRGLLLLQGNGDFTFTPGPSTLEYTYVYGAQYADLNGDGRPDLALSLYPDDAPYEGLAYSVNLGAGGFSQPTVLYSTFNEVEESEEYGTPVLIADYNGDGAPDVLAATYYSSGIFYNTGAITMALTSSSSTAAQDSSVTLTATLTPTVSSTPATGTVTFYDNGVATGTATVTGNAATLTLTTLPVGANVITAVYSGDTNYNSASSTASVNGASGSTSVGVTALPAAFTMAAATGSSLTLTAGQTGTATFTVTGNSTFSGAITFACTGAPSGTACTVLPSPVTLTGAQTATITVVLATTAPNNTYNAGNSLPTWIKTTGGITLAGGLLLLLPSRRRRQIWPLVLLATLGLGATVALNGCGSSGSSKTSTGTSTTTTYLYPGTPAGSYTVNVTATSGSMTQTGAITLAVHD